MRNIISLCGERRRGKDFLTQALIKAHPGKVKRLSFSDEVRRLAIELYPWFDPFMNDELKDKVYDHPNNTQKCTGREILLTAGRVRDVDGQYFVRMFQRNQIAQIEERPDLLFVITDFRNVDEYEAVIKPLKIPTVKIHRQVDPVQFPPHGFEGYIRNFKADYNFLNDGDEKKIVHFISALEEEQVISIAESI